MQIIPYTYIIFLCFFNFLSSEEKFIEGVG